MSRSLREIELTIGGAFTAEAYETIRHELWAPHRIQCDLAFPNFFYGAAQFDDLSKLEDFLVEKKVPFHITYLLRDTNYSNVHYWRPGMEEPDQVPSDDEGEPKMSYHDLCMMRDKGCTLEDVITRLKAARSNDVPALIIAP
jgi:hypothetical protein